MPGARTMGAGATAAPARGNNNLPVDRSTTRRLRIPAAWLFAACYLAFGLAWIVFSDRLGEVFFTTSASVTRFQTWKGVGFTVFSAVVVLLAAGSQVARRRAVDQEVGTGPSVVALLSMLVLATGLPMVALLGWGIFREAHNSVDNAERLIAQVASGTASELGVLLDAQLRSAAAIAERPGVRQLNPSACDALGKLPGILDAVQEVSLFDAAGHVVCGSAARRAASPPAWRTQFLDSQFPLASPVRKSESGEWIFAVVQPVLDAEGRMTGAVELLLPAAALARAVDAPLPNGGSVTVMDQTNTIVARWPGQREYVGRTLRDQDQARVRAIRSERNSTMRGADGVVRLYASRLVGNTGWVVAAGVPVETLYAPAREALLRSLAVALAMVALCTWLVLRLSRTITQPLSSLHRAADAAAAGDFSRRAPEAGPSELAAVATGFNRMVERLPELQREVRQAAERTAQLVERLSRHVPSMIFVYRVDAQGHGSFPYASQAIRHVFELEPDDVQEDSGPAFDRMHLVDAPRVIASFERSRRDMAPFQIEFRVVLPARGVRHVLAQAQAERTGDEIVWYGSMSDVTELHASQEALRLMNETLEHRIAERTAALASANSALEAFAYSVAHDLRAPLHSIEGFTQGVQHALAREDTPRALGFTERVLVNTTRMNLLIDGFLALARAGRSELDEAPVDQQRLVLDILSEMPRPANVQVVCALLPRLIADPASLRQVWHNLLSNALKYSARNEQPRVRVEWSLEQAEAVFRVQDNGAGFDPAYAHKLFQPFSRLHKPQEFEGNGVGLAVVRRIVERHGGRVWAESEPGQGATFYFAVPAERVIA
jgi:signal transduction histidine kinase